MLEFTVDAKHQQLFVSYEGIKYKANAQVIFVIVEEHYCCWLMVILINCPLGLQQTLKRAEILCLLGLF